MTDLAIKLDELYDSLNPSQLAVMVWLEHIVRKIEARFHVSS